MRLILAAAAVLLVSTPPAFALNVRDCDDVASASNLLEPWEANTKTFYKGEVRVAVVDTGGEPACCSAHLLIILPDKSLEDEGGGRICKLVEQKGDSGFMGIYFDKVTASYDAKKGLLVTFPYQFSKDGDPKQGTGKVRVNITKGTVTPE